MAKLSKRQVLKAIEGTGGIIEAIVRKLKVSRVAYWKFENKFPELKKARDEERLRQVDMTELKLFEARDRGEKWAVLKIISTLGKDRGYVERSELDNRVSGDSSLVVRFVEPDKNVDVVDDEK